MKSSGNVNNKKKLATCAKPTKSQQIIMHLYLCHLMQKSNGGWNDDVPQFASTEYTRMYSTIVHMDWHKSDLAGCGLNSLDAEEDWDSEWYGRCTDTPIKES
jgi:hypothetical protein